MLTQRLVAFAHGAPAAAALLVLSAPLLALQPCEPQWQVEFPSCNNEHIDLLRVFHHEGRPVVYGAGALTTSLGPIPQICRFDPDAGGWFHWAAPFRWQSWTITGPIVGLETFDVDGSGPEILALSGFKSGAQPSSLWRWAGEEWVALANTTGYFTSMAVFDDGTGPALYVGGHFSEIGGVPVQHLARWRGIGHPWEAVGNITAAQGLPLISAMHATSDGGGAGALYIAGRFSEIDGVPMQNVARREGIAWTPLGDGISVDMQNTPVTTMTSRMEGNSPALYIGGSLQQQQGFGPGVARWHAGAWSRLDAGLPSGTVRSLAFSSAGGPSRLHVGTNSGLRMWDGAQWQIMGAGEPGPGRALVAHNDGAAERLIVGGRFMRSGVPVPSPLASWDGADWSFEPCGLHYPPHDPVQDIIAVDVGGERSLLVGGGFYSFNNIVSRGGLRWDGQQWHAFGDDKGVRTAVVFDDGTGPAIYAGTRTCIAQGQDWCNRLGRWDPLAHKWTPVGGEYNIAPLDLATFDDGAGEALYIAKHATPASSTVARWDGQMLTPVGNDPIAPSHLAVFDDGSGKALHAAGSNLWRWNGTTWDIVGGGISSNSTITLMEVLEESPGKRALYIAGNFSAAGNVPADRIVRWDGQWMMFNGLPPGAIYSLTRYDDGTTAGADLYAALVSGAAGRIVRWTGTNWITVADARGPVTALRAFDDGRGNALWAGGNFQSIAGVPSGGLARYTGCERCYANCDGSTQAPVLNVDDFTCFINEFAAAMALPQGQQVSHYANCDASTTSPVLNVDDFLCFINAFAAGCP